mgnify:CR=1 FL=1
MTIKEIIDKTDTLKPNQYSAADKMDWLSDLDGRIMQEVILRHEHDTVMPEFSRYTSDSDDLLADDVYCDLYIYYLMAKIDFYNAEYVRYNNSSAAFNQVYADYARNYHQQHMPIAGHWKNL